MDGVISTGTALAYGYIVCRYFLVLDHLQFVTSVRITDKRMAPRITFGADPEFFVRERATKTIIPACGLFGGEKGAPILLSGDGGYLEDGVTIEINVAPQARMSDLREKVLSLKALWEQRFPQHELVCQSHAEFTKVQLRAFPQAMQIGCAGDLCAWGIRRAPQISDFGPLRFAGGHIHIGLDPWPEYVEKAFLIKWLDMFALLPTITEYSDIERFEYYGRPGLYRNTSYGVEWRSPDPMWVTGKSPIAEYAEESVRAFIDKVAGTEKKYTHTRDRINAFANSEGLIEHLGRQTLGTRLVIPRGLLNRRSEYLEWAVA